jgi:class 3 adenylate cyclase
MSTRGERPAIQNRRAIIFFSDIAGFSIWSASKPPNEVARHLCELATIQINAVRGAGGQIDKLMGDGAMPTGSSTRPTARSASLLPCSRVSCRSCRSARPTSRNTIYPSVCASVCTPATSRSGISAPRTGSRSRGASVNTAARYEQAKSVEFGEIRISPILRDLMVQSGANPTPSEARRRSR